jgi:hypothetical protein
MPMLFLQNISLCLPPPPPVALQSLKDLGRLTYRRFLELFREAVGLLGRVISPSQGLYLHRTTEHRKTRTNIHALSGIRTRDPSNQPAKTHASDRMATVTGIPLFPCNIIPHLLLGHVSGCFPWSSPIKMLHTFLPHASYMPPPLPHIFNSLLQ